MAGMKGVVRSFNEAKGFGFITPDDGSKDIFVHFSEVEGSGPSGFKTLVEGQRVEFQVRGGPKGIFAAHVIISTSISSSVTSLDQEEQKQANDDDTNEIEEDQE